MQVEIDSRAHKYREDEGGDFQRTDFFRIFFHGGCDGEILVAMVQALKCDIRGVKVGRNDFPNSAKIKEPMIRFAPIRAIKTGGDQAQGSKDQNVATD